MFDFRKLEVFNRANETVGAVTSFLTSLRREDLRLRDQISGSATSVVSNIAEATGRKSIKEFLRFLDIASGSNAELQAQLELCATIERGNQAACQDALALARETGRMLGGLIRHFRTLGLDA